MKKSRFLVLAMWLLCAVLGGLLSDLANAQETQPNPSMEIGELSNILPGIELLVSNPNFALVNLYVGDVISEKRAEWQAGNPEKQIIDVLVYYHNDRPFMLIIMYAVAQSD
jgi:hypothetical protein